ncbi:hypothetical protein FGE12_12295 [Aggregicoccus sp. 17bor-14]|uniref:hypothetical protein n=1 Tax=Myxococcaceae TaxID=31 RepID=UPI00129C2CB6|nr:MULTISPECIES: hypothetical protein [Myxococcaceae]MBF5043170.1 hypothetical protein [Simulacricoccus sp. 17bor-14]MRI88929.1 hypothetical protein [Aggregicoccus sp. 17bor-14]
MKRTGGWAGLQHELAEVEGAVRAAQLLVEAIATRQLGTQAARAQAPWATAALLSLVLLRLRLLGQVLRGETPAGLLGPGGEHRSPGFVRSVPPRTTRAARGPEARLRRRAR